MMVLTALLVLQQQSPKRAHLEWVQEVAQHLMTTIVVLLNGCMRVHPV